MEAYQNDIQLMDDVVDLKELILVIWKHKIVIISFTLIVAIVTGLFSMFILTPAYHSELSIVINMPDIYHTKYGDYTLPITSNVEYINLITSNDILAVTIEDMQYNPEEITIEDLRERINIVARPANASEQNIFNIKVEADNPEEARKLAQTLYDNYIEFLNIITIKGAMDYYYHTYTSSLRSMKVSLEINMAKLEANEALLAETRLTINQKEALEDVQGQINSSEFIILENIINPNYTAIEAAIIENKQSISSLKQSIEVYNTYIEEVDGIYRDIEQYYLTGDFEPINSKIVSVIDIGISMPSQPIAPSKKTSPSNFMNVLIGAILGGMVSVLVVFFRWWWNNGKDTKSRKEIKVA